MLSNVIAALYGEGDYRSLSRVARHTQILSCLRRNMGGEANPTWDDVIHALRRDNLASEALFLSDKAHQERGMELVREGMVITLACKSYPKVLLTNLGVNAPPLFWLSSRVLRDLPPWDNDDGSQRICVSGVGCRTPLGVGLAIANLAGNWAAEHEYLAVSGGAHGCDEAFGNSVLKSGGQVVHLLPYGLAQAPRAIHGYAMTVCPPNESFSAGRAMERNNLIYAFGHTTLVCSARYRTGGSWQGAVAALKAHRPVVVADWTSQGFASTNPEYAEGMYGLAQKALRGLGAYALEMDLASFRQDMDQKLDAALDWSFERFAGEVNSGLFAS